MRSKDIVKRHDFKVGLFIEDNKSFLSLEFIEDNHKVEIHKIALDYIDINRESISKYTCNGIPYPAFGTYEACSISFPVVPVEGDKILCTIIDLDNVPKEMSIKEIEKQLGYSIKIKGE